MNEKPVQAVAEVLRNAEIEMNTLHQSRRRLSAAKLKHRQAEASGTPVNSLALACADRTPDLRRKAVISSRDARQADVLENGVA